MGKLANLRKAIPEHKIVDFPGTKEKVAIVALNSESIIQARESAVRYLQEHPLDVDTADLVLNSFVLLKSMRHPEDLSKSFADSFEEIQENTSPKEIYQLHSVFLEVQNGKTPDFEEITMDELEDIKKKLLMMELKDLDGELQTILKYFHQTLISKALQMGS
jgi:hypothetical protein